MENVIHQGVLGSLPLFFIIFALAVLGFWIKTIVEIANSEFKDNSKVAWLLVVILVGAIGMIIYYAVGRSQRITTKNIDLVDLDDL